MSQYTFKIATESWEFDQVHRLNYQAFVQEIPQHSPNAEGLLVDKFHSENTYIIGLRDRELVGMLAVRAKRPFSLDEKLGNIDCYLPAHNSVCEVRLLVVKPGFRYGWILAGLLARLSDYVASHGHDLIVISATVRQLKLYRHIGGVPFGALVGTREAQFQPMYFSYQTLRIPGLLARAGVEMERVR